MTLSKLLSLLLSGIGVVATCFLVACSPIRVQEGSQVTLSYTAKDPETLKVLHHGEKTDLVLDFTGSALFQLLQGAQKGESKSEILQDPFLEHQPEVLTKQSALVLQEMGIPFAVGERVSLGDQEAVIVDFVNENGVELAVLDSNPRFTREPLLWEFTITEIK